MSFCLKPNYKPNNIVTKVSTAIDIIQQAGLTVPCPASLYCDLDAWRKVIDMFSIDVITELGNNSKLQYSLSEVFKTLSIKLDTKSPYETEDILNIEVSSKVSDVKQSKSHISTVFEYCVSQLPPVTAGLIGGYLSEVRIFERSEYLNEILPLEKNFGGLHNPYTRSIEIIEQSRCSISNEPNDHPYDNSVFSCLFLHEIGHTVHTLYGFLRPGGPPCTRWSIICI